MESIEGEGVMPLPKQITGASIGRVYLLEGRLVRVEREFPMGLKLVAVDPRNVTVVDVTDD